MTERPPTRAAGSGIRRGQILGERYEVRDRLAADAFSVSLVALDQVSNAQVVLRVVRPGLLPEPEQRQEAGAKLRAVVGQGGRFLPGLRDADLDGGRLFAIEAFPQGATLRDLLTRRQPSERRLRPAEALPIAARLDAALAAVPAGIWHGDVQASNLWLSKEGMALTGAFLVAALPAGVVRSVLVAHPTVRRHFAPEVLEGGGGPASDRYAAALTLYEALTGTPLPEPGAPIPAGLGGVGDALAALLHPLPDRRPPSLEALVTALARQAGVPAPKLDPGIFRPSPTGASRGASSPVAPSEDWDDATSLWQGGVAGSGPAPSWEAEDTQTDAPVARIEAPVLAAGAFPKPIAATAPVDAAPQGWDDEATQQVSLDDILASPEATGHEPTTRRATPAPGRAGARPTPPRDEPAPTEELDLGSIDVVEVEEAPRPKRPRPARPLHKPDLASMDLKPIPRARRADSIPPATPSDWQQGEAPVLFDDSLMGEYEPTDPTGRLPAPLEPPTFEEFSTPSDPPSSAGADGEVLVESVKAPPALNDTVMPEAMHGAPRPRRRRLRATTARRLTIGSLVAGIFLVAGAIGWNLYQKREAEAEHTRRLQERLHQIQAEH